MAQQVLKYLIPGGERRVNMDAVLRAVAEKFNLQPAQLKQKTNAQQIAYPRQIAMYLIKELTHSSLPEIGTDVRRQAPHHGSALRPEDRQAAPARCGFEQIDTQRNRLNQLTLYALSTSGCCIFPVEACGRSAESRKIHRFAPRKAQSVVAINALSCYNLERNQRFNSPYESSSSLIKYYSREKRIEKTPWNSPSAGQIWFAN